MGFPWVNETKDNNSVDWDVVGASFKAYFDRIEAPNQCCLIFGDTIEIAEVWVFEYKDMKFPNEDNWGKLK